MTDERMSDVLRVVGHSAEPDQAFLERLYDDLAIELGFRPAAVTPVRPRRVRPRRSRSRWLLAAAAMLMLLGGSAVIAGAAVRLLQERRPPDVLDTIRAGGTMAIMVRDGLPQARSPVGILAGFDVDVATEIARRLGVTVSILPIVDANTPSLGDWHLAMGSPTRPLDPAHQASSAPVYFWPIHVVVPTDSTVTSVDALDGVAVCVVEGSLGEAWLTGRSDLSSASPIQAPPETTAVTRPDDEACLDALAAGTVAAVVTADLGPAELAVRGAIRALDGPVLTEERGFIVDRDAGDVEAFLAEIDAAIEAARADGTLSDLARSRFGGHDLSVPPLLTPQEE